MFAINDDYVMQTHHQIMIIERSESKDPRSRNLAGIPIHEASPIFEIEDSNRQDIKSPKQII